MSVPKISVIIPVHNGELYIGRCIRSLLDQSIKRENYELIVINDGSNDKTEKVLEVFMDEIKYYKNASHMADPICNRFLNST